MENVIGRRSREDSTWLSGVGGRFVAKFVVTTSEKGLVAVAVGG